jgi:hypothetical protein
MNLREPVRARVTKQSGREQKSQSGISARVDTAERNRRRDDRSSPALGQGVIEEVVNRGVHRHVLVAFHENAVHFEGLDRPQPRGKRPAQRLCKVLVSNDLKGMWRFSKDSNLEEGGRGGRNLLLPVSNEFGKKYVARSLQVGKHQWSG